MSFLTTQPDLLLAAAGQLQSIGSAVTAANSTAAFAITGVVPAAADEVSVVTAATFAGYGQQYQAISAEAGMIHEQFVSALGLSADSYAATEAANATQAAGGHFMPAMPVRMVPAGPARLTPAMPTRVAPAAPNRVAPAAPARPAAPPARPMPAAPSPAPATSAAPGWHGGGYGYATPQNGGYAGYGAANYGRHQTPYGGGNYGGHPAPRVEHVAPAHMAPAQHVEHVAPAHAMPLEHVARADVAPQHVSPAELAPTAPVHRESLAAAIPAEKVLPMHLPAGTPTEHVIQAHAAFKAAAGPKPLPALA
ncbi:hypothetical protein BRW65_03730 [Mycobacterium paraffinicum]|uniref:PE domain-containing protein n=1 Tax=Mycobacterium paraffinicum TaxID=53378 RepID=A0A1Q4I186_9MYCO|nr:hypothetical protein BRW65_03730 [Mycobacterium paraffinicum]